MRTFFVILAALLTILIVGDWSDARCRGRQRCRRPRCQALSCGAAAPAQAPSPVPAARRPYRPR